RYATLTAPYGVMIFIGILAHPVIEWSDRLIWEMAQHRLETSLHSCYVLSWLRLQKTFVLAITD
ncbi:MAG TPA: hypothetical protein V6D04_05590, partial [Candidatus Obscuribacterales bacterium]